MPRSVRDSKLDTRSARFKLGGRRAPYWRAISQGLHIGYRKPFGANSGAGKWLIRRHLGKNSGHYKIEVIATADDFADADGKTVLNFSQAQRHINKIAESKSSPIKGAAALTVADVMESYLNFLDEERKSGVDARYRANAFILPKLGKLKADNLDHETLRGWLTGLAKAPPRLRTKPGEEQKFRDFEDNDEARRRRRSSANRVLTTLKAALNHAFHHNTIASNAAWAKVKAFKGADAARIHYLSIAEANRLVNATDLHFRPMVRAALYTGARYGELANLTVADFNTDSKTLAVRQSKSGKPRHIALTDEGVSYFRQLCAGRVGSELLLPRPDGERWGKSHQDRPMRAACERAKILPRISIHGLRHTYASLAAMNGMPLIVLAKNLGHADTRMVERHYGHLAPDYIKQAVKETAPRFGFKQDSKIAAIR
jgi:integrase